MEILPPKIWHPLCQKHIKNISRNNPLNAWSGYFAPSDEKCEFCDGKTQYRFRSSVDVKINIMIPEKHWKKHEDKYKVDFNSDPLGLQNVCIPTEPIWLNEYHDTIQKRVFYELVDTLDPYEFKFLELGCGAGRWSQRLYNQGWRGMGIDLQESLINSNNKRIPGIVFIHGNFIGFNIPEKFEMIFSITVLQHIPPENISQALFWIREHLDYTDRFIMLENISFNSDTVFSYSIDDWTSLCQIHGLRLCKIIAYDHSFCLKLSEKLGGLLRRQACWMDSLLDPLWRLLKVEFGANHAGFVFSKY